MKNGRSGKHFTAHAALDNLMSDAEFDIPSALVLNKSGEVVTTGRTTYMPIYFLMFLGHKSMPEPLIYRVD